MLKQVSIILIAAGLLTSCSNDKIEKKNDINPNGPRIAALNGLTLREAPSQSAKQIQLLKYGTPVEVTEIDKVQTTINDITTNWIKIKTADAQGWVWGEYVKKSRDKAPRDLARHHIAELKKTIAEKGSVALSGGTGFEGFTYSEYGSGITLDKNGTAIHIYRSFGFPVDNKCSVCGRLLPANSPGEQLTGKSTGTWTATDSSINLSFTKTEIQAIQHDKLCTHPPKVKPSNWQDTKAVFFGIDKENRVVLALSTGNSENAVSSLFYIQTNSD